MAGLFSNMVSVEDEITHCRRRETEERRAADQSTDVSAREAHLDLAGRYAARASQLAERTSRPAIGNSRWGDPAISG